MFLNSFGDTFETQRSLEEKSLKHTVQHFPSSQDYKELSQLLFDHWIKPPIFEDSKEFLQEFLFICLLSFDVYLKKVLIERLIDELPDYRESKKSDKKKKES